MTRQQKIDHLKRKGYKVVIAMQNGRVHLTSPSGNMTVKDSVNQAHALIFGY